MVNKLSRSFVISLCNVFVRKYDYNIKHSQHRDDMYEASPSASRLACQTFHC